MLETGTVKKVLPRESLVEIKRSAACKGCPVHKVCFPEGCETMEVSALNEIGAQQGHKVKLFLKTSVLLRYSFIAYIFPLIVMFIAIGLGSILYNQINVSISREAVQIIAAVVGLVFGFIGIRIYQNRVKDRRDFKVRIIEIIRE